MIHENNLVGERDTAFTLSTLSNPESGMFNQDHLIAISTLLWMVLGYNNKKSGHQLI